MEVAVVAAGIEDSVLQRTPWIHCRSSLADNGVDITVFRDDDLDAAFERPFDAMLLQVWQDWLNRHRFAPEQIMPVLEKHAAYRARFPETTQIALNHADDCTRPYCLTVWRQGDPVLYRTPPYRRSRLEPLPEEDIWAYEKVLGTPCFAQDRKPWFRAGFIGRPTGPDGYRRRVARQTARVGIGICLGGDRLGWRRPMPKWAHDHLMSRCRIIVCPRGWGQQSSRHWDAWLSGKPVLTDRACDAVEMIPGRKLEQGIHYLVFDDPEEIPALVREWTRPGRRKELERIARNGHRAARSYRACDRILEFFRRFGPTSNGDP